MGGGVIKLGSGGRVVSTGCGICNKSKVPTKFTLQYICTLSPRKFCK